MNAAQRRLARRSAWAHRASFVGTAAVLALAGLLLSVAGVLTQTGVHTAQAQVGGGLLLMLAMSYAGLVLSVTLMVVVSTVSLALRGRRRELALMRTVGATSAQLRAQIGQELLWVTLLAAPAGAGAGLLFVSSWTPILRDAGFLDPHASLSAGVIPVVLATVILVPVVRLAARLALRETLRTPPGPAARTSTVESTHIGAVRRVTALGIAVIGMVAALSPLGLSGTSGGASAASSALLLVGATALAGPLLVRAAFGRAALADDRLGASGRLAVANARGFARRLTIVVVPLALALTVGTAQTSVDRAMVEATQLQLREGLRADLVVPVASRLAHDDVAAVADLDGVHTVTSLVATPAHVLADADLEQAIPAMAWQPTLVRGVDPASVERLVDLDVTAGEISGLAQPDTIAISRDATLEPGFGIGGTVPLRWPDGRVTRPTVTAVYERGLGFGDYLVPSRTIDSQARGERSNLLLVDAEADDGPKVAAGLAALGLHSTAPESYAAGVTGGRAAERRLSSLMLLSLLGFVLLAAANTLVMVTVRRRDEFALYGRTGATRRQVTRMATLEALLTGGLAWLIGSLAVLPAVLGVSFGMLGPALPVVNPRVYLGLSAVVVALPLLTVVPASVWITRRRTPAPG